MQTTINQRIDTLILHFEKGISKDFATKTGIPPSTLSTITGSKKATPKFDTLAKIAEAYPSLNLSWLLKGIGDIEDNQAKTSGSLTQEIRKMVAEEVNRVKNDIQQTFDNANKNPDIGNDDTDK